MPIARWACSAITPTTGVLIVSDVNDDYPFVLIRGNPVDGFEYIGPFPGRQHAAQYGNTDPHTDADWWIAPLHAPAERDLIDADAHPQGETLA
jgi:hypothetical protein